MSSREAFSGLERRLAAQGVPGEYARRLVEELRNDLAESVEAEIRAGASEDQARERAMQSIGDEREIARTTIAVLRKESWLGRHRVDGLMLICVVVFPLAVMLLDGVGLLVGYVLVGRLKVSTVGAAAHAWKWGAEAVGNLLIPIISVWWLARVCRRNYCGRWPTIAACGIACVWAAALRTQVDLPHVANAKARFMLGIYLGWPVGRHAGWPYPGVLISIGALWLIRWLMSRGGLVRTWRTV